MNQTSLLSNKKVALIYTKDTPKATGGDCFDTLDTVRNEDIISFCKKYNIEHVAYLDKIESCKINNTILGYRVNARIEKISTTLPQPPQSLPPPPPPPPLPYRILKTSYCGGLGYIKYYQRGFLNKQYPEIIGYAMCRGMRYECPIAETIADAAKLVGIFNCAWTVWGMESGTPFLSLIARSK
jgi:hypothetical protein